MKCSSERYDPPGSLVNPNGAAIANPVTGPAFARPLEKGFVRR